MHFDRKYTVAREGSTARYIGVVLSGSVEVSEMDYYGNRSILAVSQPGDAFGEAFACAGVPSLPVTVTAREACDVMLLDSEHILHTCEHNCGFHNRLIYNLMRDLAEKTVLFHERIEITSKRTTRDKLLAYLLAASRRAGSASFTIPFDRQQLADYLEVDRSGLSAEISKLRREGILESKKSYFRLLK
jgi:CRP-like cAMP-binding protein